MIIHANCHILLFIIRMMDRHKREKLRSELGLESSQWKIAERLSSFLHDIDQLPDMEIEVAKRQLLFISRQLYGFLFHTLCFELLDQERRCLWFYHEFVSFPNAQESSASTATTNGNIAPEAQIFSSGRF